MDDKNYVIGIDEDALKGFIQENTQDTNTVTTVAGNTSEKAKGTLEMAEMPAPE